MMYVLCLSVGSVLCILSALVCSGSFVVLIIIKIVAVWGSHCFL